MSRYYSQKKTTKEDERLGDINLSKQHSILKRPNPLIVLSLERTCFPGLALQILNPDQVTYRQSVGINIQGRWMGGKEKEKLCL